MPRKLSKQQKSRIEKRRQTLKNDWLNGLVVNRFVDSAMIQASDGSLLHCKLRQSLGSLVVGDLVFYSKDKNDFTVEAIHERVNCIAQTLSPRKSKLLVANIGQLVIINAISPGIDTLMIDTLIAASELNNINPVLVLNKIDLLDKDGLPEKITLYKELGYTVLYTCAISDIGIDKLAAQLENQASIFVGHSGVGKSSLSNVLIPNLSQQTKNLTPAGCGSHTTSTSHLFDLPQGGCLIDSPGIREFKFHGLSLFEAEKCFKEFQPYVGKCKFRNCTHHNEPCCAIIEAVNNNYIKASRYSNFKSLLKI